MASDPNKPLLRLMTQEPQDRLIGQPRPIPRPEAFSQARQVANFSPKFNRLAAVLQRDPAGLELRADPAALAPERLLVFEVKGAIGQFGAAIRRVPGLELIDEEELAGDEDKAPMAYLLLPDMQALRELESLWRRWQRNELVVGETPWRDVFALLRDLRAWGPADRLQPEESDLLSEEIFGLADDATIVLEIELVYRSNAATATDRENEVRSSIVQRGGRVLSQARIDDIAYHALLAALPVPAIREIISRTPDGIAGLESVMYIRPQSVASGIELADSGDVDAGGEIGQLSDPILALLDGVPVAAHPALAAHLVVDDQFGLEPNAPVANRVHGTAMASLITRGDRNRQEVALPRRIHVVPVMGAEDSFPANRLIVDLIYSAVVAMRIGEGATAPNVVIVNLSLGNSRRPFHGSMSAWARLLDRLAYRFGILFVVSAGNCKGNFGIPAYPTSVAFEGASPENRAAETLRGLGQVVAERRLFSPAETVNGVTVGACNEDWVSAADRTGARAIVDPYGEFAYGKSFKCAWSGVCARCQAGSLDGGRPRTSSVHKERCSHPRCAGGAFTRRRPKGGRASAGWSRKFRWVYQWHQRGRCSCIADGPPHSRRSRSHLWRCVSRAFSFAARRFTKSATGASRKMA